MQTTDPNKRAEVRAMQKKHAEIGHIVGKQLVSEVIANIEKSEIKPADDASA